MEQWNHPPQIPEVIPTADEKGQRILVYPSEVRGRFNSWRKRVQILLVLILMILPWIEIRGHQAVLLDIPNRKFAIFGVTFWAHDAPMLVFVLAGFALTLAFVTALWGRIWCGWACPQTVFIDGVYRKIESWIEGDSVRRRQLDRSPWSASKFARKTLKWGAFTAVSAVISHTVLAYFVGTEALAEMMSRSPAQNPTPFLFMAGFTALFNFDFGWFREQFCSVVCPYGRFQSILVNDGSLTIAYDQARGEPRRGVTGTPQPTGDCVDCRRCVTVCPTGIDIRNGAQLECIACTACIDACDDVMARLKKPLGLVGYIRGKKAFKPARFHFVLLMVALAGMTYRLAARQEVESTWVRAIGAPYQVMQEGVIVNHYRLDLVNQSFEPRSVRLSIPSELKARGLEAVMPRDTIELAPGAAERVNVFFRFPSALLEMGRLKAEIALESTTESRKTEVSLVGPLR